MQISNEITRRGFLKKTTGVAVGAVSFPYIVYCEELEADFLGYAKHRLDYLP